MLSAAATALVRRKSHEVFEGESSMEKLASFETTPDFGYADLESREGSGSGATSSCLNRPVQLPLLETSTDESVRIPRGLMHAKSIPGRLAEAGFTKLSAVASSTGKMLCAGFAFGLLASLLLWHPIHRWDLALHWEVALLFGLLIGVVSRGAWDQFWSSNFLVAYRLFHDVPAVHQAVGFRQV